MTNDTKNTEKIALKELCKFELSRISTYQELRFFTIKETASLLNRGEHSLRDDIEKNLLPVIHIGKNKYTTINLIKIYIQRLENKALEEITEKIEEANYENKTLKELYKKI